MLYVLSGALSVALDGSNQLVSDGGGVFIPAGRAAIFSTTSSESARWLQFILAPAAEAQKPPLGAPASVEELADGKTEPRAAGMPHFERSAWVHQWANPGDVPLVLLQANISQEGVPAVLPAQSALPK